jgi:hypothetical protein
MSVVVHKRSDWTSRAGTCTTAMPTTGVKGVVYHWPGSNENLLGLTLSQVCSRLRGWQNYHMDDRGYCDIAYQWAVADIGGVAHVFPLRTFSKKSAAQDNPNRAGSENSEWYAVLVLFGMDDAKVTSALLEGMRWCRNKALARTSSATETVPHSYFGDTDCPGDVVRAAIPLVKSGTLPEDNMSAEDVAAINAHTDQKINEATSWLKGKLLEDAGIPSAVWSHNVLGGGDYEAWEAVRDSGRGIGSLKDAITALGNTASLAAAIAAQLPPSQPADQSVIETALRNVLGSLDSGLAT